MLAWVKKQSVSSCVAIGAAVLTLVAMIIYIANSTTGYMTGSKMDALPVVFSVISIVLLAALVATSGKLNHWVITVVMIAVVVLLSVSLAVMINARTDVAGDQWFIPGMATAEKGACLNGAIAAAVFYVISIIAVVVTAVTSKSEKI